MLNKPPLILLLCFLGIASTLDPTTLNPTLAKSYFFVDPNNQLSYELYQTRYGILASSIETSDHTTYFSQHLLIDLNSRDAKPVLTDLVKACELVTPTYPHLHYHVQTDSVVYFCYANNSLLLIDQSSYTVEKVIPFNISGSWPVVKLSTDGMSVAVLLMGDLFTTSPKASMLVKVDMQVRQVTAEIWLNKDFGVGEAVVAYASNKKAAYIATNRIQAKALTTTIYSFITIGNSYQITPISTLSATIDRMKIVTKLFSLGNYIIVNNGTDLCFINQNGAVSTTVPLLMWKSITRDQDSLRHLAMTSQYGSNDLYIELSRESVFKYTVVESKITSKELGGYGDFQIAYGNQTSGDLMFTTDFVGVIFKIIDLKTSQLIYTAVVGYTDVFLTNSTYAVLQAPFSAGYDLYIFDLKDDTLKAKIPASQTYDYSKEQNLISFLSYADDHGCDLTHIDLVTAKVWKTLHIEGPTFLCYSSITGVKITENGNAEFVAPGNPNTTIFTESYGALDFQTKLPAWAWNKRGVNFDFDSLTFYFLDSDPAKKQIQISLYAYNPQSKEIELKNDKLFENITAQSGFFFINKTSSVGLENDTVTIFDNLSLSATAKFSANWNFASSFEDSVGNEYVVLTKSVKDHAQFQTGSTPGLFFNGKFRSLPGLRGRSVRAQATGVNSYAISDAHYYSLGLVRFYDASRSNVSEEKILISI